MRIPYISILAAGALALGGCAYGGFGYGVGYGGGGYYGDYGYGAPYFGYGYGAYDPFGWYGDYYYPGTGIYIYDAQRRRHAWSDDQRHYWEGRRQSWHGPNGSVRSNWRGFRHRNR
jgi:hypothetical protein